MGRLPSWACAPAGTAVTATRTEIINARNMHLPCTFMRRLSMHPQDPGSCQAIHVGERFHDVYCLATSGILGLGLGQEAGDGADHDVVCRGGVEPQLIAGHLPGVE